VRQIVHRTPVGAKRWIRRFIPLPLKLRLKSQVRRLDQKRLWRFQTGHANTARPNRSLDQGVAVIVPCYNHAPYLGATMSCLAQQTLRPYSVVFVDDWSTDRTWELIQRESAKLPVGIEAILLQTPKNSGQAYAINHGIGLTDFSVYMVLNDDDYLLHDALEAAVAILSHRTELYMLGAGGRRFSGAGLPPGPHEKPYIRNVASDYGQIPLTDYRPDQVVHFRNPNDLNMMHTGTTYFRCAWELAGGYYPDKLDRVVVFGDRDFQLRVASLFRSPYPRRSPSLTGDRGDPSTQGSIRRCLPERAMEER